MDKIYFIIPTINGEIAGDPYIVSSTRFAVDLETTIYQINLETLEVKEIDD